VIITESDLRQQLRQPRRNARVTVPPGATFTPAAADFIRTWQLDVHEEAVAPRPDRRGARAAWDRPGAFPVVLDGAAPTCVTCGMVVTAKPGHLTQLDAAHFALKTDPRIRLRGRLDTLQGLCLLAGSRALAAGERELAGHLDTLAAYCRELMSAEYHGRLPEPLELAGMDEDALRAASHDPSAAVGIAHVVPALEHPELLHWLNVLRCEVREAETAALDALPPEHHPGSEGGAIAHALNRLSSAVYYLVVWFAARQGRG
jgi:ethanolamine utilization cobalamin adenosyltransferase